MTRLLLFFGALLFMSPALAQDIIIKSNGEEVRAKVFELTPDQIKYKLYSYPDGPLITILKRDVFMIKYADGSKETMAPASAGKTPGDREAEYPQIQQEIKLGGPRLGFTLVGGQQASRLRDDYKVNPFLTQFGWQFETRLFRTAGGLSGLAEVIPLVGGLEQGKFLPSLSALVGLRAANNWEFGVGPNVSMAGAGLVFALGTTFHAQGIHFPVNLAVVPGNDGTRVSLLFGFNSRKN
jgi:hypothetical protein